MTLHLKRKCLCNLSRCVVFKFSDCPDSPLFAASWGLWQPSIVCFMSSTPAMPAINLGEVNTTAEPATEEDTGYPISMYIYIYVYCINLCKNYMFTIQVHLHSRSLPLPYGYSIFPVSDFPLFLWTGNIMGWQYLVSLKRSSGPSKQSCFALQPRICSAFSNLKTSQNSWWRIRNFMEDYVSQKWFPNVSGQQWSWNINITSISSQPIQKNKGSPGSQGLQQWARLRAGHLFDCWNLQAVLQHALVLWSLPPHSGRPWPTRERKLLGALRQDKCLIFHHLSP